MTRAIPFRLAAVFSAMSAVALLTPSSALAQQDDFFKAGLDARGNKNWQEVVTQMRKAIQISPQEDTRRVRSGIGGLIGRGGTEYLPHFFLGEAFFNLQDCANAVDEWGKSERQGAVKSRSDFYRTLQNGYAICEMKGVLPPSKYEPLLARTTQHVFDVNNQAGALSKLGSMNDLLQGQARDQYDRAYNEVQTARTRLEMATKSHGISDFSEANAAADRAGAILTTLENTLNSALAQRLSIQAQANDIEQSIDAADGYDRTIEGKKASLTQGLAATRQQGRDALVRARDQLDVGRRTSNAAALNDARSLTKDATTRLKQVADEVVHLEHEAMQHQLADAAARSHEAFSLVDGAFANLDRLSSQRPSTGAPDLSAKEDALQLQVASARRRLETAINGESLSGIVDAGRQAANITAQLNELISSFGPLTLADRGVHPALINGAKLYFAGQYKEALATLSPEGGFAPDVPLQLHVHLFKAAAAYALFLLSGATNDALRQQALAEIGECKRLDTSFEPDARAFTPRFIAVFHSGQIAPSKTAVARSQ